MFVPLSPIHVVPQLRVDTTFPSPDTTRAAVVGEIDMATTQLLHDALLTVLRERPSTVLNVDLSGVTFLDCTGLGTLVVVQKAAARVDSQMWVTGYRPIVHRMLDLTGLLDVLAAPPGQAPRPVAKSGRPARFGFFRNLVPKRSKRPVAA